MFSFDAEEGQNWLVATDQVDLPGTRQPCRHVSQPSTPAGWMPRARGDTYLDEDEVDALLGSCDLARRTGRRDHAVFALTIQTGSCSSTNFDQIDQAAAATESGATVKPILRIS